MRKIGIDDFPFQQALDEWREQMRKDLAAKAPEAEFPTDKFWLLAMRASFEALNETETYAGLIDHGPRGRAMIAHEACMRFLHSDETVSGKIALCCNTDDPERNGVELDAIMDSFLRNQGFGRIADAIKSTSCYRA
ncbi:MAG: hypothetical protein VW405_00700 [Rhodospirillaceae bacterium]